MRTHWHNQEVEIIHFPETRVAVFEHHGDSAGIGESVRRFIAWRKEAGLCPDVSDTFNILYNDPVKTAPEHFRLDLCAATEKEVPDNNGIVIKTIPAGRCATLRDAGPDYNLHNAFFYLYNEWLPKSGEERRDFPPYLQRVILSQDSADDEHSIDIFMPLK